MRGKVIKLPKNGKAGIIRFNNQDFSFTMKDVKKRDRQSLAANEEVNFTGNQYIAKALQISIVGGAEPEKQKSEQTKKQGKSKSQKPKKSPFKASKVKSDSSKKNIEDQTTKTFKKTENSSDSNTFHVQSQEGFVNPYNFVPLIGNVSRRPADSHELWKGHSGRIRCLLKLKTPFFFPDSEQQEKNADGHEWLYLLRNSENHAIIPGSELKGAFSNVAEALANGCVRIFDDALHFGYRPPPNKFLNIKRRQKVWEAGIVKRLPTRDKPGKIARCQVAKVRFRKPVKKRSWQDDVKDALNGEQLDLKVVGRGFLPWAKRGDTSGNTSAGHMKITDVPDVKKYKAAKKSQRWFFDEDPEDKWFGFTPKVAENYNAVHATGFQMDARDNSFRIIRTVDEEKVLHKWALPEDDPKQGIGGLRPHRKPLSVGDLVYCVLSTPFDEMEDEERETDAVKMLLAAEVGRVRYQHGVADGLPEQFKPCSDIEKLCPVCRLWGYVMPDKEQKQYEEEKNLQGFIRFSTAHTVSPLKKTDIEANVTLSPLAQPHASAMSFYLQEPNNPHKAGSYGKQNEISRPFSLRGRKFYWHQEPKGQWSDTRDNGQPKQDSQNKTVELLKEGTTFTFTVEFDNLSDADLGLLLLTLQPSLLGEENVSSIQLYHHLGMGKPLGLGSAGVVVDKLTLINRALRYQSLAADGICDQNHLNQSDVQKFIKAFVKKALEVQGQQTSGTDDDLRRFAKMEHIESLLIMLDWEHKPENIQYPPGSVDAPEESFRWFMDVNERLLTPCEIANGNLQRPF